MVDKRSDTTKKPVKDQTYFPQANPGKRPRGKGGKGKGR